jgi:hypothetical protein
VLAQVRVAVTDRVRRTGRRGRIDAPSATTSGQVVRRFQAAQTGLTARAVVVAVPRASDSGRRRAPAPQRAVPRASDLGHHLVPVVQNGPIASGAAAGVEATDPSARRRVPYGKTVPIRRAVVGLASENGRRRRLVRVIAGVPVARRRVADARTGQPAAASAPTRAAEAYAARNAMRNLLAAPPRPVRVAPIARAPRRRVRGVTTSSARRCRAVDPTTALRRVAGRLQRPHDGPPHVPRQVPEGQWPPLSIPR